MKNRLYKLLFTALPLIVAGMGILSCQKMLDVEPDKGLEPDQFYKDKFDADDAVIGIYGQFLGLAKQYVLLNELRGDLMDVTSNADQSYMDLSNHNVGLNNPLADPKPFYKVILSCNDALKNFEIMKNESKMTEAEYNQRYSDVGAIRSWLYLQLVIHYGHVPYITEPLLKSNELKDFSRFPVLSIEEMVTELIGFMEAIPYKNDYELNSSLMSNIDGYSPKRFFINKKILLGDLHLWKGEYTKAATYYKDIIGYNPSGGGTSNFDIYKLRGSDFTNNRDLNVRYLRYKDMDFYSLIDNNEYGWKSMFINFTGDTREWEWIWVLQFDKNFNPQNPFIDLFAKLGGHYLVKPSQSAIDKWNSQTQRNGFTFDQRGKFTYQMQMGEPVIMKYIYSYNPLLPLEKTGKWFLTRAALVHLRFAEAANRDGKHKLASALLNDGIMVTYDNPQIIGEDNAIYEFRTGLSAPYDFDAANTAVLTDLWHRNEGVRRRGYVTAVNFSSSLTPQDSLVNIENALIDEAALELAYEGNRWADLVRIAIRRDDPSFLADRIYDKLQKAGRPDAAAVRAKLMNRENWFLPFKW